MSLHVLNSLVLLLFCLLCLFSSSRERSLLLPGKSNGFVESPDIFLFFLLGALLPYLQEKSLAKVAAIAEGRSSFLQTEKLESDLTEFRVFIFGARTKLSVLGKRLYGTFLLVGFIVVGWNSIQNQAPLEHVGMIGWDTIIYPSGYWITRVLRIYLWMCLAPTILHIHMNIVVGIRRLLLSAASKQAGELEPFHSDECGGAKVFIDSVLNPTVPVILGAGALSAATIYVHGSLNVTTVGGLVLATILAFFTYLLPGVALRRLIVSDKMKKIEAISDIQNRTFRSLVVTVGGREKVPDLSFLEELSNVKKVLGKLPNWPQLRFLVKVASLSASPTILGALLDFSSPAWKLTLDWLTP